MPARLRLLLRGLLVLGLALAPTAVGCKKKPPKLTPDECQRFCRRLVPCFAEKLADFSMKQEEDTRECIQNCQSKEGQQHAQILRAMKRCGDIKDCDRLRKCFGEVMQK